MQHEADHRLPPETAEIEGERKREQFSLKLEGFNLGNLVLQLWMFPLLAV